MRKRILCSATLALFACGHQQGITVLQPVANAYVASGQSVPVAIVSGDATQVQVSVDGGPPLEIVASGGVFQGVLGPQTRGSHVLTIRAPEIPGLESSQMLYVDRMPGSGVTGYGSTGNNWMVTIGNSAPVSGGLFAGTLTLASVSTSDVGTVSRVLSASAITAGVGSGTNAELAWIDGWSKGHGTLHVGPAAGGPTTAFPGVQATGFSADGTVLAGIDDGFFVVTAPFQSQLRVMAVADGAGFFGDVDDVLSWVLDSAGQLVATVASPPAFEPIALSGTFIDLVENPILRDVAVQSGQPGAGVAVYRAGTGLGAALFSDVGAFGFSPDGRWLVAVTGVDSSGDGSVALEDLVGFADQATFAGTYQGLEFDPLVQSLFLLDTAGNLSSVELGDGHFASTALATNVARFAARGQGGAIWEDLQGGMWVRLVDGTVLQVGSLNNEFQEVALATSGFAFTALEADGSRPVHRVSTASGQVDHFGTHAHLPTFMADGAFAWAEVRADAQAGGVANDDLWIFPGFPQSLRGAQMIASRVQATAPFQVSPDGEQIAVLSGLPVGGAKWAAEARCFDIHLNQDDLGPADATQQQIFFRSDDRVMWFGPEGGESTVLWLGRCHLTP